MATMIPDSVTSQNGGLGKAEVFKALRTLPSSVLAFHSVRCVSRSELTSKSTIAEIDFVLVIPDQGILVIEVRRGEIVCRDGVWTHKGRAGAAFAPFRQAERRMFDLARELRQKIPETNRALFGWAVWFPDMVLGDEGAAGDCDRETVFTREDLTAPEAAIERAFTRRWRPERPHLGGLSPAGMVQVRALLSSSSRLRGPEGEGAVGQTSKPDWATWRYAMGSAWRVALFLIELPFEYAAALWRGAARVFVKALIVGWRPAKALLTPVLAMAGVAAAAFLALHLLSGDPRALSGLGWSLSIGFAAFVIRRIGFKLEARLSRPRSEGPDVPLR